MIIYKDFKLRLLIPLLTLFIIFMYSCGPKELSYEEATKWYNNCQPHPKYHPGDWYAYQDICHEDCTEHGDLCAQPCIAKGYPIATHVEGGYYTDGSYYASCPNTFGNIHPTKDKYVKTKWQTDRDECLQNTYENVKRKHFWSTNQSWMNHSKEYYKGCIKVKGYDIEKLKNANKKSEGVS